MNFSACGSVHYCMGLNFIFLNFIGIINFCEFTAQTCHTHIEFLGVIVTFYLMFLHTH